ncbi:MAG: efflux RND transporter periplasmic adaptor subunit, partial [Polyangiaceae bacterium]
MRPRIAPLCTFGLALAACHPSGGSSASAGLGEKPGGEAAPPIHVQTEAVARQPMPDYLTLTGSLRANRESDIAADASGRVLSALAERGEVVKRGQVIATLDSRTARLSATAAQAQAKLALYQLGQARRECARVKHLLDSGAISQAEFDRQTSQCSADQFSATAAEAQQESATTRLGDTQIRAPFDGIIGERLVDVGQHVEPSTRVASIYEPDPLRLILTIPEASLASIHAGMLVTFRVAAFGSERFHGTLRYISPNVRESSRDLVAEAVVANVDGRLKPGMFAVAKLEIAQVPSPVVDSKAVVRDGAGARVFVVGADKQIQE